MAKFNFRHGIARRQEDSSGNPMFLQKAGQYVNIHVSPDPTVFIIAHFDVDYLFAENRSVPQAWGPFNDGLTRWLYWDVDFITGEISRGSTLLSPIDHPTEPQGPHSPDQHWFDMTNMVMKVWSGSAWVEKLRIFAAEYTNSSVIVPQPIGSQVGRNNVTCYAGAPLIDENNNPLQKFRRDRRGQFITTETPLSSQFSRVSNFRVEAAINQAEAIENIPIHFAVTYDGYNRVRLARNGDIDTEEAIGISAEPMITSEARSFITKGFVQNEQDWDWSEYEAGTALFVGPTGQLVPDPPQTISIQKIAVVVDKHTVFVNPEQRIIYG